jgi:hypothetical protein
MATTRPNFVPLSDLVSQTLNHRSITLIFKGCLLFWLTRFNCHADLSAKVRENTRNEGLLRDAIGRMRHS